MVITVSLRIASEKSEPETRAPDRTLVERFFPWKSHTRRSKSLSLTAFACNDGYGALFDSARCPRRQGYLFIQLDAQGDKDIYSNQLDAQGGGDVYFIQLDGSL